MGLNSNEIAIVLEKSFENTDDKNKLKYLILNKNFSALKKWVSSEKFNLNSSGKSDFQNIFQTFNKNPVSNSLTSNVQSETILSNSSVLDNSLVSSVQTSGSANGTNIGGGTNGYTLPTNFSNEIQADSRIYESTPDSFFERTVIDQIVSKVSFKGTGGQEEIKVHLEPPSLGSLQLKVSVEGKAVNATIVADNNITKEIIQSNLRQLKDSMADQGLKLDDISVLVGEGASSGRDMDEYRMFLARKNMDQPAGMEENISSNPMERNSGSFYRAGYMFSQSGVDLFI